MKIIKILLGLIILIFLVSNVNAFGVASPFASDSGPVVVGAGESKDLTFSIQNGAGGDIIAKISVLSGSEIIEIDKNGYLVPAGGEVPAKIRVKVPENAGKDDKWYIKLSFKATSIETKGDTVNMDMGITTGFNVVTVAPPKVEIPTGEVVKEEKQPSSNLPLALAVVIIAGIAIYLYEKKKKKK